LIYTSKSLETILQQQFHKDRPGVAADRAKKKRTNYDASAAKTFFVEEAELSGLDSR
jgi:hypothetical protein